MLSVSDSRSLCSLTKSICTSQKSKDELFSTSDNKEESEASVRQRDRMSRELLLKKSSQLSDDLLTVTRLIRDNTEKSSKTVDRLGKYPFGSLLVVLHYCVYC